MSFYSSQSSNISSLLLGTVAVAAIVITLPTSAYAATRQEVAQIAKTTTVQINNEGSDSPGGSGVIIAKQGNTYTVLTANHVVCDALDRPGAIVCSSDITYSVRTHTGKEYSVKQLQVLQKSKDEPDLAVVTFEATENYPVATLGNSDQAEIAADIFVAGFPAAFGKSGAARDFAFTKGLVVSRANYAKNGYSLIYDARTLTGNSGGPVFDVVGRVVAIHGEADASAQEQSETGSSVAQKTGFNAGIPINTFLAMRGQISNSVSVKQDNTPTGEDPSARLNNPQSARDFYARGLTKIEQQNYQGAIKDLNQAIRLDPNYARAYNMRGASYIWLKQYQAAIQDLNQAIRLDPNYARAYNDRGVSYIWLKDYQAAIQDLNQAIRLNPNYASAYNNRAALYKNLKQYQAAIQDLNQAIRLNPNYATAYSNRGFVYGRLKDYKDYQAAIQDLNQAIRLDPNHARAYSNRGFVYGQLKDYQAAIQDLNQAVRLDPNDARAYNDRGFIYGQLKDYQAAIQDLNQAIRLDPNDATAYNNRGGCYKSLKDYNEALADYKKAAEIHQKEGNTELYQQTIDNIRNLPLQNEQGL